MGRKAANDSSGEELSRQSILKVAIEIFSENGYRATSLEQVAERLGVTRPSLYYYYKNKQDILLKADMEASDAIIKTAQEIFDRPLPVKEKFFKLIENHVVVMAKNAKLISIFYEEEKELLKTTDRRVIGVMEKRAQDRAKYTERWVDLYREGVAEGVFRNADPEIAVLSVLGACNWVYRWYHEDGKLSPENIAKSMAKLLASGYIK